MATGVVLLFFPPKAGNSWKEQNRIKGYRPAIPILQIDRTSKVDRALSTFNVLGRKTKSLAGAIFEPRIEPGHVCEARS
jgi:hypothetical protein